MIQKEEANQLMIRASILLNAENAYQKASEALELAKNAMNLIDKQSDEDLYGKCLMTAAVACGYLGKLEDEIAFSNEAINIFKKNGSLLFAQMVRASLETSLRKAGKVKELEMLKQDADKDFDLIERRLKILENDMNFKAVISSRKWWQFWK